MTQSADQVKGDLEKYISQVKEDLRKEQERIETRLGVEQVKQENRLREEIAVNAALIEKFRQQQEEYGRALGDYAIKEDLTAVQISVAKMGVWTTIVATLVSTILVGITQLLVLHAMQTTVAGH